MKTLADLDIKGLVEAWANVEMAWLDKDYEKVVANLIVMADKIGEVTPVLAPVLFQLIEKYGATLKPMIDEMFASGTKTVAYFYENTAEAKKKLLPQIKKYAAVEAQIHMANVKAHEKAGFSHNEAMDILLAGISGARQFNRSLINSLGKSIPKLSVTNVKKEQGFRY